MRKTIMGTALALSLAVAGTAQADTVTTTFDSFADGSVNGQGNTPESSKWAVDAKYDVAVVPVTGGKALRVSNAVTAGSFSDMLHSAPVTKAAGENEATNVLVNEFTVSAPDTYAPGLFVTVSPDDGQGSRMSRLRLEDSADGVKVMFTDATFEDQFLATLDRSVPHTIKFETTFVRGDDNDVVRIFIDGQQMKRGASWENYYRFDEERNPSPSDRLLIRTSGAAAPIAFGTTGFLFDDVTTKSHHVNNPAPLNPPAPGPAGQNGTNGTNGTNGVDGKDGVNGTNGTNGTTTIVHDRGLAGASLRTLHIRQIRGMKFLSAKATLGGKRLSVKGRTVKVDLRDKDAGTYRVRITAKYRANGKTYTVRRYRNLHIVRK
jgi:hypothetical protein